MGKAYIEWQMSITFNCEEMVCQHEDFQEQDTTQSWNPSTVSIPENFDQVHDLILADESWQKNYWDPGDIQGIYHEHWVRKARSDMVAKIFEYQLDIILTGFHQVNFAAFEQSNENLLK